MNPERRARLRRQQFDPAGTGGPHVSWMRRGPCDTCGAVGATDPSHVIARGMGGAKGRSFHLVRQCWRCHDRVEQKGWGAAKEPALALAARYAWDAHEAGRLPESPPVPKPTESNAVLRRRLRGAWTDMEKGATR